MSDSRLFAKHVAGLWLRFAVLCSASNHHCLSPYVHVGRGTLYGYLFLILESQLL